MSNTRYGLYLLTIWLAGCSTFVDYPIGVPPRPDLRAISAEQLKEPLTTAYGVIAYLELFEDEIADSHVSALNAATVAYDATLTTCAVNQSALKTHVLKLENRIQTHDDLL